MATADDVRRIALSLPETDEHPSYGGRPSFRVRKKSFARLLDDGESCGVWTESLEEKEALLASDAVLHHAAPRRVRHRAGPLRRSGRRRAAGADHRLLAGQGTQAGRGCLRDAGVSLSSRSEVLPDAQPRAVGGESRGELLVADAGAVDEGLVDAVGGGVEPGGGDGPVDAHPAGELVHGSPAGGDVVAFQWRDPSGRPPRRGLTRAGRRA